MAQLSDDCFAFGGALIPVGDALAQFARRIGPVAEPETVPLARALGRVLAEDVVSAMHVPPHDNSAVDGYAVYFDDLAPGAVTSLPLGGRAAAGHPLDRPQRRGEAVRIFTGAPMPTGENGGSPDTVMMQEDCREENGRVAISPGIRRGANRRFAGEDVRAGSVVLTAGDRLRPQDVGLAAAIGRVDLPVFAPLRAAVFSTGDEVRDPGGDRPDGAIYDSNRYTIAALLAGMGCRVTDLGILPDNADAIRAALDSAAAGHDVIVTSGGVSAGAEDHVKAAVEALGQLHFWRLAIKPGRPVALGQVGRVPFLGLPGNPVAVMVTFLRIARPLLLRLAGARPEAPKLFPVAAGFAWKKKADRREYLRVRLEQQDGRYVARRFAQDGAGILSSMAWSDGLVELPEAMTAVAEGDTVDYLPFSEVGL